MRNKMFKNFDQNVTDIIKLIESLLILLIIILATTFMSWIAYSLWELSFGIWGFHVSKDTFPIVGAIGLCALQLSRFKV